MEYIPSAMRLLLNICFYCVYTLLTVFLSGFLFPVFGIYLDASDPVATQVTGIIALGVAILTLLFKKFFYIPLKKEK